MVMGIDISTYSSIWIITDGKTQNSWTKGVGFAPKGTTGSSLFIEVKPRWTRLITGWVTNWEKPCIQQEIRLAQCPPYHCMWAESELDARVRGSGCTIFFPDNNRLVLACGMTKTVISLEVLDYYLSYPLPSCYPLKIKWLFSNTKCSLLRCVSALRKHDVVFLVTVRPTSTGPVKYDRTKPFREQVRKSRRLLFDDHFQYSNLSRSPLIFTTLSTHPNDAAAILDLKWGWRA